MSDIRKRIGKKGATYQVRYVDPRSRSGYRFKTFRSSKAAKQFCEDGSTKNLPRKHDAIGTVEAAVQRWLDTCEHEGRDGKDPVSKATFAVYESRAAIMRVYPWDKDLADLESPDVVAFRSWLLKNYTRDQAQKVMSSFHSVLLEMVTQGVLSTDPASKITVRQSRYKEPVEIPSVEEVQLILRAADDLANDPNYWIARAWKRYQPMIYLAVDSGLRPQEYLAAASTDLLEKGIRVTRALDRSNEIGPPKSRAGRRYIPLGKGTLALLRAFQAQEKTGVASDLLFPGEKGSHQQYGNFRRRCWEPLMAKAGLVDQVEVEGELIEKSRYSPYALRHFFASAMIASNKDLKTIQEYMGHEDAAMTLNVYGHLIRMKRAEETESAGIVSTVLAARCGESVAQAN